MYSNHICAGPTALQLCCCCQTDGEQEMENRRNVVKNDPLQDGNRTGAAPTSSCCTWAQQQTAWRQQKHT